jgi:hypothetical protein
MRSTRRAHSRNSASVQLRFSRFSGRDDLMTLRPSMEGRREACSMGRVGQLRNALFLQAQLRDETRHRFSRMAPTRQPRAIRGLRDLHSVSVLMFGRA